MIQICFSLVDTQVYCCLFRDVGSKWIRLGNDADFEQEPSETENKQTRDSTTALFNLVYGSNSTSGLKWSGPAVGHVQHTTVGNLLQYIHVMSLWNWPTNWPETRLTPDSTCRIIFRSQSGSQSALNAARLKCKLSVALMDHKVFNTLTSSWFIRAVHAIELFIPTVTQEERQFWKLIWH